MFFWLLTIVEIIVFIQKLLEDETKSNPGFNRKDTISEKHHYYP